MAKNLSAVKRAQIGLRNNLRNRRYKSSIKTMIKKIMIEIEMTSSMQTADYGKVNQLVSQAYSKIDKAVKKGAMHQNSAARKKSILANRLRMC